MMKKYLMMGIAALALASCSKDDITYINPDEAKYEMVFVNRFGTPDPNHTWGFGSSTRALTRAMRHNVTFPDAPAEGDYKTTYPSGTPRIQDAPYYGYSAGGSFYADETSTGNKIELNSSWNSELNKGINGGPLYLVSSTGNPVTIAPSYFYVDARNEGGAYVYVCPGVTLELNAFDSKNLQGGLKMYIAEGAKLKGLDEIKLNSVTIYNAGTIEAPNLHANGTGILYNQGVVNIENNIKVTNATSFIVNEGEINATNYGSEGSGSFWNVSGATMNISGTTTVNSNSNGWINDGDYTTGTFLYNAGSINVWNNCRLTCTTIFDMTLGDSSTSAFQMDGGAGIDAASFHIAGPARITMGENSLIKVSGTATMDCGKADYGIYGPTSGYAVFQANKIVAGTENQGAEVTYGNNLYIYSETTHFEQGYTDATSDAAKSNNGIGNDAYIRFSGGCSEANIYATNFNGGKPTITITSECNSGFNGDDPDPTAYDYRVMAEDLSTNEKSDFDFNDVVFDVKYVSSTVAKVKVRAAGGIYPIRIDGNNNYEIHALLHGNMTMLNTFAGHHYDLEADEIEVSGSFGSSAGSDEFKAGVGNIKIEVSKDGSNTWVELTAPRGKAASKIGVPVNVDWCDEYQDIDERWGTGAFAAWVASEQAPFWKGL